MCDLHMHIVYTSMSAFCRLLQYVYFTRYDSLTGFHSCFFFFQAEDGIRDDLVTGVQTCAFFFQAEDGIRDDLVTGVQTCALPISLARFSGEWSYSLMSANSFLVRSKK